VIPILTVIGLGALVGVMALSKVMVVVVGASES